MYGPDSKQQSGCYATTAGGNIAHVPMPPSNTPPATLVGAISASGALIDRLINLGNALEGLAMRLGGPWPAEASGAPATEPQSAMAHLCGNLDTAHRLVSHMEGSLKAMGRVLEG